MAMYSFLRRLRAPRLTVLAGLATVLGMTAALPQQAEAKKITVVIKSITAVKSPDAGSAADFFARVWIAGKLQPVYPRIKDQNDIRPNWDYFWDVAEGKHDVIIQVLDKDAVFNDRIDINRLPRKRELSVTIDTRTCEITNISGGYRCGVPIKRTGDQNKAARIIFTVVSN